MRIGLDMEAWRALPPASRQVVTDWVRDYGLEDCVEYVVVNEGQIDALEHVREGNIRLGLWWVDGHGGRCVSTVKIWRRGLPIPEVPPVLTDLDTGASPVL